MDGGAWWAAVHGIPESGTTERFHFHFSLSCIGEGNGYAGQEAIVRHVDLLADQGTHNNGLLQVVQTASVGKE